jgi:hypothetical protein
LIFWLLFDQAKSNGKRKKEFNVKVQKKVCKEKEKVIPASHAS